MRTSRISVAVIGVRIGKTVAIVGVIMFGRRYNPLSIWRNKNVPILYLVIPHRSISSDLVGDGINSIDVKFLRVGYSYSIRAL